METVATTATEKPVTSEAAPFAGRAKELAPEVAPPGAIAQLFYKAEGGEILRGLTVSEGFRVLKVLVGRMQFPSEGQTDWKTVYGTVAPPGSYVITLVQNETQETKHVSGCWYVEGGEPAPAGSGLAAPATGPVSYPVAAGTPVSYPHAPGVQVGVPGPSVANAPVTMQDQAAVKPGVNEVVVFLLRSEAQRLYESVKQGMPLYHHEQPGILRRIGKALGLPG